jgi:hypothetical protein
LIKRIYIFILIDVLIQNSYVVLEWFKCDSEWLYYKYYPATLFMSKSLLPLYWTLARLVPMDKRDNESWVYLVSGTFFIFQAKDVWDCMINENVSDSTMDFVVFVSLNVVYWLIFRKHDKTKASS